jgi:alkylation response protein AidB-like acyl-CoA dehydrogenase
MNFKLSAENKLLKEAVHEFLVKEYPKEVVRKLDESDEGYTPELWKSMAELGWLGLIFPEQYDGMEGSLFELVILIEEMGYNLCPCPFFSTVILGGMTLLKGGNDQQKKEMLPKISKGERLLTLALTEPGAGFEAKSIQVKATSSESDYVINGTKLFVPDAQVADYILCATRTEETSDLDGGITIFLVDAKSPGIKCTPLKTLARDKQCEVLFNDVRVPEEKIVGKKNQGWSILKDVLKNAALARSGEMIGGAKAVMDMALSYSKKRVQFNRPIGSFQTVQHNFANMWADINGARNLVYKAAFNISKGDPAGLECAMAKARAGETYRRVTLLCHQIFGGIGFTSEHDMHLYHRRAMSGDLFLGNVDFQRELVAKELGL